MCGRYVIAKPPGQLALDLGARLDPSLDPHAGPNYNTAPTHTVPILLERLDSEGTLVRELHAARWGLVPFWAKELSVGAKMFNARSETVTSKPSFRAAVASRRCAIPADGYYEWLAPESGKGRKQPFYVHPEDGSTLCFAGLYEWWKLPAELADSTEGPAGSAVTRRTGSGAHDSPLWLLSCSILTTEAPSADDADPHLAALGRLHHRLPVGLAPETVDAWLTPEKSRTEELVARVREQAHEVASHWRMHPVGTEVGSVASRGPQLIEPAPTLW